MTQEEQIYWQGFMDKCAEFGIDGGALIEHEMQKQAQMMPQMANMMRQGGQQMQQMGQMAQGAQMAGRAAGNAAGAVSGAGAQAGQPAPANPMARGMQSAGRVAGKAMGNVGGQVAQNANVDQQLNNVFGDIDKMDQTKTTYDPQFAAQQQMRGVGQQAMNTMGRMMPGRM